MSNLLSPNKSFYHDWPESPYFPGYFQLHQKVFHINCFFILIPDGLVPSGPPKEFTYPLRAVWKRVFPCKHGVSCIFGLLWFVESPYGFFALQRPCEQNLLGRGLETSPLNQILQHSKIFHYFFGVHRQDHLISLFLNFS